MSEKTEFIVKDGCFIRRTTTTEERNLGTHTQLLRELAADAYTIIPDVGIIEMSSRADYENHAIGEKLKLPLHLGRNNTRLYAAHRLPYWPMYGPFSTTAKAGGPLTYCYHGVNGETRRCGVAYPGMWILYRFGLSNHRVTDWSGASLITNIRGRHFAPLLPNVFDSGKICFGELRPQWSGNIVSACQTVLDGLMGSGSNDHLMERRHREVLCFTRTDENGFTFSPPDNFWRNPESYHTGRGTTVAADMLVAVTQLEETEYSLKVSDEHPLETGECPEPEPEPETEPDTDVAFETDGLEQL